jgi:hypothetical protein
LANHLRNFTHLIARPQGKLVTEPLLVKDSLNGLSDSINEVGNIEVNLISHFMLESLNEVAGTRQSIEIFSQACSGYISSLSPTLDSPMSKENDNGRETLPLLQAAHKEESHKSQVSNLQACLLNRFLVNTINGRRDSIKDTSTLRLSLHPR